MSALTRMFRLLRTEPAALQIAVGALYTVGMMVWRASTGGEAVDVDVMVSAAVAMYGLYTRSQVTPVTRPRDGRGRDLHPL